MTKLTRIDQYVCIDTDKIIADEMRGIIESDCYGLCQEDLDNWAELQQAAKIILWNYVCHSELDHNDD
jgi:hypothetical protein